MSRGVVMKLLKSLRVKEVPDMASWTKVARAISLTAACIAIATVGAYAGEGQGGNHAGAYLRMTPDARAAGMGGAYVGWVDDASSVVLNPAGLLEIPNIDLGVTYTNMDLDRTYNAFFIGKYLDFASFGFAWVNAGTDDISLYDVEDVYQGSGDASENAAVFSVAKMHSRLSLGASFKILTLDIVDESEVGWGIDLGAKVRVIDPLTFGIKVQDIGAEVGDDAIPVDVRAGAALTMGHGFLFAIDIQKTEDQDDVIPHFGAQYSMALDSGQMFAARVGMDDDNFTAGAGFEMKGVRLDYAYLTEKEESLGDQHRISLAVSFCCGN
jgi:hypothetical protein